MGQAKLHQAIRALNCIPKIGIPLLLSAVLWFVAGDKRLMDAFARFAFDAYLVGIVAAGVAVAIAILMFSRGRS
jgi:hypothetical protein